MSWLQLTANHRLHCAFILMVFLIVLGCRDSEDSLEPQVWLELDAFTEAPVFDYQGNLFVSEPYGTRVMRLSVDGKLSVWKTFENPNGHRVLPDRTHILCVRGAVLRLDADANPIAEPLTECEGVPFREPNDFVFDRKGGFYFSDPGGSRERPVGTVHHVDSEWNCRLVANGLWVPNGVLLSLDGKTLYVAETQPNRILYFDVYEDGSLGPLQIFANLPNKEGVKAEPDGMALDTQGNIYVAHLGMTAVQVLSPEGILLRSLPAGNYDPSNVVFWGSEMNELYISGSIGGRKDTPGRVFRLDLKGATGISHILPEGHDEGSH